MNLKIVGTGHLGVRLARLWKDMFPDATIILKTKRHDLNRTNKWKALGFDAVSEEEESNPEQSTKAPFVVFCAPPTNNANYVENVESSIKHDWDLQSTNNQKGFVFTSSGGVYAENSGGEIDENSEVSTSSERTKTLISAEQCVLQNGGDVIRFGGLYTKTRGAHNYWLSGKISESPSNPNGLINLIHYDDAARVVLKTLLKDSDCKPNSTGKLFLAGDGVPISRENICQAALKCPEYKDQAVLKLLKFTGDKNIIDGKRYNISFLQTYLDWKPVFTSFKDFMEKHYNDELDVNQFWEFEH